MNVVSGDFLGVHMWITEHGLNIWFASASISGLLVPRS